MTIKVGDEVQVYFGPDRSWSNNTYTVLVIQDCDNALSSEDRKWAVVAYKSDIPQVFKLKHVRKPSVVERVTLQGCMDKHGALYVGLGDIAMTESDTLVEVYCTKVDGNVDLSYPYTVLKKG
jgi:hypothetical protein